MNGSIDLNILSATAGVDLTALRNKYSQMKTGEGAGNNSDSNSSSPLRSSYYLFIQKAIFEEFFSVTHQ